MRQVLCFVCVLCRPPSCVTVKTQPAKCSDAVNPEDRVPRRPRRPERQGPQPRRPVNDYFHEVDYFDDVDYFRSESEDSPIRCVTPTLTLYQIRVS